MRALIRSGGQLSLKQVPQPATDPSCDTLVRVVTAGLCRTDIDVAACRLGQRDPLVLGHEFAGYVETPSGGSRWRAGARVTCMPFLPCGKCNACDAQAPCSAKLQLGVELDGAFADYVRVPGACLVELPEGVDYQVGAFAEPVAAAMAVLDVGLPLSAPGVVLGSGRIAELCLRVMVAAGYTQVTRAPLNPEPDRYEFCVETQASSELFAQALRALAPRGTLVLKSRSRTPVGLDVGLCVKKQLRLVAAEYGDMRLGLEWLESGRLAVRDLFADPAPLESFESIFRAASTTEERKLFFGIA